MNSTLGVELRSLYAAEFARVQSAFDESGDGRAAVAARTRLVESILLRLWTESVSSSSSAPSGVALVALGGFGRASLFPYSDIDILFLFESSSIESKIKVPIRDFSQALWDLRLKLSPTSRKISECDRFDPENLEFAISLLDCRYLAGDRDLFLKLRESVVPRMAARESKMLVEKLGELTRTRHARFGFTVFHLEPNVKDAPGGLRDHNLIGWLSTISSLAKGCGWDGIQSPLSLPVREQFESAFSFLTSVRCFLHFRHGRDDNTLAWEAQDEAAARRIGLGGGDALPAADWMRAYFLNARAIYRVSSQLLEEIPVSRPSLHRQFQSLRSRLSNSEFSVVEDFIYLRQPESIGDPQMMLRAFRFMARHGLKFNSVTENQIQQALPAVSEKTLRGHALWVALQEILLAPHAAEALREMHNLGLLNVLLPEFAGIDSLVVRDYSHRYTVDEHTFVAIENLHRLRQSQSKWDQRYAEILDEIEQPELLYLALLLHDTGKGAKSENHVRASVDLAEKALDRLGLDSLDRETVLFLIARHLEMSSTLRRDIFDPATVRSFAEKVGTPERLKMLCLLTYADIKAVSPDTLTPWKAENIWQLYIGAANDMIRTVDERLHVNTDDEMMAHLRTLAPAAGKRLEHFLEGLPRRYLRSYSVEEILSHMEMAERLAADPVQLSLRRGRHWYEITLVTRDRPYLFSNMTGVLSAWGMNIVKAAAFSNQSAAVVDTFYFTDRFRTLELNLPEWDRFKKSIQDVLSGRADLEKMLRDRMRSHKPAPPKVIVNTDVLIDDEASEHSTLVEVLAQDRPGLLHRISSQFAQMDCNIEIAVIETEGQMAIDVFYLTSGGGKLSRARQLQLREALLKELP
ncbi:MAG TPA: [protein-PII] uridylyltransferase [Candidatus Acidoferrum sp.]|nr:[protein-PII] uridylyltransferase [Candidatus Acidoferrum sp.]